MFYFLSHAAKSEALNASRYRKVLAECGDFYPGSSEIAMRVLGRDTAFLLCDTDSKSVRSLWDSSRELGILRVRCESADGQDLLWNEIMHLSEARAQRLFVFLDPWSCMAPSELNGRSSLELFRELSRKGAAVVLWVGFDSMEQRKLGVKFPGPTRGSAGHQRRTLIVPPRCQSFMNSTSERKMGVFRLGSVWATSWRAFMRLPLSQLPSPVCAGTFR